MIQIIGAGAIGCLWLAKLLQSKEVCHIVSRHESPTSTLLYTDITGKIEQFSISHSTQLRHVTIQEQQSTILVCVKAYQVLSALLMQKKYIQPQQAIILMHNGYGCAEEVIKHFPENPIICATTANASLLNAPLNITETGNGPTFLGPFTENSRDLSPLILPLQTAATDVNWSDNIIEKCWLKLAINAAINPLTAINNIKNGDLKDNHYQIQITALLREVAMISKAENINLHLDLLQNTVNQVIIATADNFSSMNRDIFYKRKTEIDFINGYLLKKAQYHSINTPILNQLYQQIKAKECR
jgi:2-dehydropantoate 2-reductase